MIPQERTRNLAVISHIDHGNTTLSDRLLELTGAVDPREMQEQFLDSNGYVTGIAVQSTKLRKPKDV